MTERISTTSKIRFEPDPGADCTHSDAVRPVVPSAAGCEDCLQIGSRWVHLRICMTCGHVGCCDDSPSRHARVHHDQTLHPIVRSLEPGESWGWCFLDEELLLRAPRSVRSSQGSRP
jgi:K+:H+ antiporter